MAYDTDGDGDFDVDDAKVLLGKLIFYLFFNYNMGVLSVSYRNKSLVTNTRIICYQLF